MHAYIDGAQDLVEEKLSHRLREFPDGHDSVKQLASFHTAGRREKRKERERENAEKWDEWKAWLTVPVQCRGRLVHQKRLQSG